MNEGLKKLHLDRGFHKTGKTTFEEYYTTYKEVEYLFTAVIDKEQLRDRIIYLPADAETSNFVIYLKEHKNDILYKELIYTSDDFRTHEDIFNKTDYVITNPPFSLIPEMLTLCKENNCKFFLFGSFNMIYKYLKIYKVDECKYIQRSLPFSRHFECPQKMTLTGDYKAYVDGVIYMSNMDLLNNKSLYIGREPEKILKKSYNDIPHVYTTTDIGDIRPVLNIDAMNDIPYDYDGYILLPVTCYLHKYVKYLEYTYRDSNTDKKYINGLKYTDGRSRYVRCLCRVKKEFLTIK